MASKKTIEQHLLEETHRPDRQGSLEEYNKLKRVIRSVDCPKTIKNKRAKQAWKSVVSVLCETNRVSEEDVVLLETAFISLEILYDTKECLDTYKKNNSMETQDFNIIQNYNKTISRASVDFTKIITLFGLSPLQKAKLVAGVATIKAKNSLAERLVKKPS